MAPPHRWVQRTDCHEGVRGKGGGSVRTKKKKEEERVTDGTLCDFSGEVEEENSCSLSSSTGSTSRAALRPEGRRRRSAPVSPHIRIGTSDEEELFRENILTPVYEIKVERRTRGGVPAPGRRAPPGETAMI
ncbi:hypothetical protein EYF80_018333 [Liparis tanakae]|uniref:Uncharacterized protein n=1 Tax=Liparis tanakae TaxID=230148 RepID=A0A4Z2I068_9TELE|nr:hypothetical protein EYF80_018333 [Liparis tanakae]